MGNDISVISKVKKNFYGIKSVLLYLEILYKIWTNIFEEQSTFSETVCLVAYIIQIELQN